MTVEIASIENIIHNLRQVGKQCYTNGPEGVYNEYSLVNELINHLLGKPNMTKTEWYKHYKIWLEYVKDEVNSIDDEEYENYWLTFIENYLDRMDVIYDFAEIILI